MITDSIYAAGTGALSSWLLLRIGMLRITIAVLGLVLALMAVSPARASETSSTAGDFMRDITGEWIGVCEQTTDGEQADNKYFHMIITQLDDNTFESDFTYYRFDEATREPIQIGDTIILSTIQPDGTVKNEITGNGSVLVYDEPKDQRHELVEVLKGTDENMLTGRIDGKVSVSGMPFGLGRNGSVRNAESMWSLEKDTLTIRQTLNVGFRVLLFNRSFNLTATNTATRGSDIVGLMLQDSQMVSKR